MLFNDQSADKKNCSRNAVGKNAVCVKNQRGELQSKYRAARFFARRLARIYLFDRNEKRLQSGRVRSLRGAGYLMRENIERPGALVDVARLPNEIEETASAKSALQSAARQSPTRYLMRPENASASCRLRSTNCAKVKNYWRNRL